jgi:hypothetical protein
MPQGLGVVSGVVVAPTAGAGETIVGLRPPLSISVAPSGMPPAPPVDAPPDPDVTSPDAVLATALVAPQPVLPAPLMPPPSKVPIPADDKPLTVEQPEPNSGPGAGLKPPTLSWVTPSGMLGGDEDVLAVMPDMPSGDVMPSAEPPGVVVVCAAAEPPASMSITIIVAARMINSFAPSPR